MARSARAGRIGFLAVTAALVLTLALGLLLLAKSERSIAVNSLNSPGTVVGRQVRAGSVDVWIIDVRRLSGAEYAVHLLASTDRLAPGQHLVAGRAPGPVSIDGARFFTPEDSEIEMFGASNILEAWLAIPVGTGRIALEFETTAGFNPSSAGAGRVSAPSSTEAQEDGEPLSGRLGTLQLDMRELPIDRSLWSASG